MSSLTVIVPAYNSQATLQKCLGSIRSSVGVSFDLLVVDDGSTDGAGAIARRHADQIICLDEHRGRRHARNAGMDAAKGDILVFIDSDVCIGADTLLKIDMFFKGHPDMTAVTGVLSCDPAGKGYFSDYKDLYMHYIFNKLPDEVSFLYGSIFALRADIKDIFRFDREIAEDTSLGYALAAHGYKGFLLKNLEVVHMKEYTALTLMANDFRIPFHWARIFWRSGRWKKSLTKGPVFAHASKRQVLSLFLAVLTVGLITTPWSALCFLLWLLINADFIVFLCRKRGWLFAIKGLALTLVDHIVMFSGVVVGTFFLLRAKALGKKAHG